jgi:transposase-like protein
VGEGLLVLAHRSLDAVPSLANMELPVSPLGSSEWLTDLERTEERCRDYLEGLRWPDGISCPRCECRSIGAIPARRRFYCRSCRHFFSVTSGTAFHNSHLPLWKWFVVIELLLGAEAGLPANQLAAMLGGGYKTAWFVEHRIRAALVQAGERPPAGPVPAGPYHRPDPKYLQAYAAESGWRARNRGNPRAFRDTVLALLAAEPVSYDDLVKPQDSLRRPGRSRLQTA